MKLFALQSQENKKFDIPATKKPYITEKTSLDACNPSYRGHRKTTQFYITAESLVCHQLESSMVAKKSVLRKHKIVC